MLKLKSENDIELPLQAVGKKGHQTKIGDKEYKLSDFDTFKKEILEGLKKANYLDLEDMVYRMQLTNDEIMGGLDIKLIPSAKNKLLPNTYNKRNKRS